MAAITSANVTLQHMRVPIDASGAQFEIQMDAIVALSSQGGTQNDIPASAFGLKRIHKVTGGILNNGGTITYVNADTDYYTNTTGGVGGSEVIPFPFSGSGSRGNITGNWYIRLYGIQ